MIAWLICKWKGHKRGTQVALENGMRVFACPRCGRRTMYKAK